MVGKMLGFFVASTRGFLLQRIYCSSGGQKTERTNSFPGARICFSVNTGMLMQLVNEMFETLTGSDSGEASHEGLCRAAPVRWQTQSHKYCRTYRMAGEQGGICLPCYCNWLHPGSWDLFGVGQDGKPYHQKQT